jgi:hypothetical protein
MSLVLLAIAVGVVAGWLRGGDLVRLAGVRIHGWPLLALGLGALLLVELLDPVHPTPLAACAFVALVIVAVRNAHLVGAPIVVLGMLANLAVLLANGTMPVDPDALVAAGMVDPADRDRVEVTGARHVLEDDDHLTFLADLVPVPWVGRVVSFGDLIVLVGVADMVANQLCRRRRRRPLPAGAQAALLSIAPPIPAPPGLELDLRDADTRARTRPAQTSPAQTRIATPAQDWGTAPSPSPVSGSQYSASPLASAPARSQEASVSAAGDAARTAPSHNR